MKNDIATQLEKQKMQWEVKMLTGMPFSTTTQNLFRFFVKRKKHREN